MKLRAIKLKTETKNDMLHEEELEMNYIYKKWNIYNSNSSKYIHMSMYVYVLYDIIPKCEVQIILIINNNNHIFISMYETH